MMDSEERALVAAIIAHLEEDTPRLVYADWLDENAGDLPAERRESARGRAEFIRLQCAHARLRYGSPEYERTWKQSQSRSLELRRQFEEAWVAELGWPANRHTQCWFQRGMVGSVWCTARYFLNHAEKILTTAPVECVTFRQLRASNLKELAKSPFIAGVHGVEFLTDDTPSELIADYLRTVPTTGLRSLTLCVHTVDSSTPGWDTRNVELARVIASCPGLAGLRWLALSEAGIGEEGARALAESPHLNQLVFLDLRNNGIGLGAEPALRFRFGDALFLSQPEITRFTVADFGPT